MRGHHSNKCCMLEHLHCYHSHSRCLGGEPTAALPSCEHLQYRNIETRPEEQMQQADVQRLRDVLSQLRADND